MQEKRAEQAGAVDSVLLWLSRESADLEWLLARTLAPTTLLELLREQGAPRRAGASAAKTVSVLLPQNAKLRARVAQCLVEQAPQGSAPPVALPPAPDASLDPTTLDEQAWRLLLRDALASGEERGADTVRAVKTLADALLSPCADTAPARSAPTKAANKPVRRAPAADPAALARQSAAERDRLERELAREHTRRRELAEELDAVRAELRTESQRASDLKKRLAAARDPGERERAMQELADRTQHELAVLRQKFDLVQEERDDLRACLEDYDRFLALPAEEVPSFHKRPLLPEELDLKQTLAMRDGSFRVLVVGGGEPQHRHTDKLSEYAEAVGFSAEWRMAEYVSWHREIDKLAADMKTRFDALVILHYNRTTFTRHARSICDDAGHKPCITCRYEGFTSLRTSLRECLRQLAAANG